MSALLALGTMYFQPWSCNFTQARLLCFLTFPENLSPIGSLNHHKVITLSLLIINDSPRFDDNRVILLDSNFQGKSRNIKKHASAKFQLQSCKYMVPRANKADM